MILTGHRHIYYQHQELFESQRIVDDLVDRIAKTLEARRDDLNIVSDFLAVVARHNLMIQVATSKGLIAGALVIELDDESLIDASTAETVSSRPHIADRVLTDPGRLRTHDEDHQGDRHVRDELDSSCRKRCMRPSEIP